MPPEISGNSVKTADLREFLGTTVGVAPTMGAASYQSLALTLRTKLAVDRPPQEYRHV